MSNTFDWVRLLQLAIQKSFNIAIGLVGLKLVLIDADISTYQGVTITFIGSAMISLASIIEYLIWKQRLLYSTKDAELMTLLEKGPGELEAFFKKWKELTK